MLFVCFWWFSLRPGRTVHCYYLFFFLPSRYLEINGRRVHDLQMFVYFFIGMFRGAAWLPSSGPLVFHRCSLGVLSFVTFLWVFSCFIIAMLCSELLVFCCRGRTCFTTVSFRANVRATKQIIKHNWRKQFKGIKNTIQNLTTTNCWAYFEGCILLLPVLLIPRGSRVKTYFGPNYALTLICLNFFNPLISYQPF